MPTLTSYLEGVLMLAVLQCICARHSSRDGHGKADRRYADHILFRSKSLIVEQIAIVYLALGLVGLVTYVLATIFVYLGELDFEQSVASTQASTLASTRANTMDRESGMLAKNAGIQTSVKATQQGSSSADERDPVQIARSRGTFGLKHEERTRDLAERSTRAKRQLLY